MSVSINYLGIKDYAAFFPHFSNAKLRQRAAQLMEEADKTFDVGSWMAFAVVAGGVFECLLHDYLDKQGRLEKKMTLGKFIHTVKGDKVMDSDIFESLTVAKNARNLIHAGCYEQDYACRSDAMSIKLTLDKLLRLNWAGL